MSLGIGLKAQVPILAPTAKLNHNLGVRVKESDPGSLRSSKFLSVLRTPKTGFTAV